MPASRRVSAAQLEELVAWMETHPLQARGSQLGLAQAKQASNCLWEELASRLNAIGDGVSKTAKEWRQYWSDLKCKVKRKGSVMRQHGSGTGGGPSWDGILSPIEDRILSLMGVQNVLGNPNVRIEADMGLDDSPTPSVPPLTHPCWSPLPSTSDHPTPTVESEEIEAASPSHAGFSQAIPKARPSKKKHVPGPDAGKSIPNSGPPRWAWELEERRIREEERRCELEERRLKLDERRLAREERELEINKEYKKEKLRLEQARLVQEAERVEAERAFQRNCLAALQMICKALGLPPQSPPPPPPPS